MPTVPTPTIEERHVKNLVNADSKTPISNVHPIKDLGKSKGSTT